MRNIEPHKRIKVSELKGISILYEDDLYDLAVFLVRLDAAQSTPSAIRHHTLHGLAQTFSRLAEIPAILVHDRIANSELPERATIDED